MPIAHINNQPIHLAPSILSADFTRLGEHARETQNAGADSLHIDIMDGIFVPNISIGLPIVAALRRAVSITLDCHLMITQPERYIAEFVNAGANHITIHAEATTHLHRTIQHIKELGASAGVALNPATPLNTLEEILPDLDLVLIMSVNPGFGGQTYIPTMTHKIARLRRLRDERGLTHVAIQVDGGIKPTNIAEIVHAGATNIVAGSAIFTPHQNVRITIRSFAEALA